MVQLVTILFHAVFQQFVIEKNKQKINSNNILTSIGHNDKLNISN